MAERPQGEADADQAVRTSIVALQRGQHLGRSEAAELMGRIIDGSVGAVPLAALLTTYQVVLPQLDELVGFSSALRRAATRLPRCPIADLDVCGTGGAPVKSFNVSTTVAFVAAAAGCTVAKHGNRASSSGCGSADVLEALGFPLQIPPAGAVRLLQSCGVTFLFAPSFHGGVRHAAEVRKGLASPTLFNLLGPLAHPLGARTQLVGVFSPALVETMAAAVIALGAERVMAVHGAPGLDEASTLGQNQVSLQTAQSSTTLEVPPPWPCRPSDTPTEIGPLPPKVAAAMVRSILGGEHLESPRSRMVQFNGAMALVAAARCRTIDEGVARAGEILASGVALELLDRFLAEAQRRGEAP